MDLVLVGVGGFAGAIARYVVDGLVADATSASAFPWGTLVINLSGSFLLGLLTALVLDRAALPSSLRGPILIGFIGAYTTFSTFMLESWRLVEAGSYGLAMANLAASVGLGLGAVFAGLVIGRAI
ncbi:MAG: fluoride efflux transporter CrcB [Candidatus Limnocylindrales bacterium]